MGWSAFGMARVSVFGNRHCNIACDIRYLDMRLVVDTAVMVASIRSATGASRHLLVAGLERRFTMLASVPLLIEYQADLLKAVGLAGGGGYQVIAEGTN
jgi:hypothetical protein